MALSAGVLSTLNAWRPIRVLLPPTVRVDCGAGTVCGRGHELRVGGPAEREEQSGGAHR